MQVSDGQVALGILQLVALALPVFAVLTQVYFTMTEEQSHLHIGYVVMSGGVVLILGAIFSAQYLYNLVESPWVGASLWFVSFGLFSIVGILYSIYKDSKDSFEDDTEETIKIIDKLIARLEREDATSVSELQSADDDFNHDVNEDLTIDELKGLRDETKEIRDDLNNFYKNALLKSFKNKEWAAFLVILALVYVGFWISPAEMSSPIIVVLYPLVTFGLWGIGKQYIPNSK